MRDLLPYLEHAAPRDGLSATSIPFAHVNRRRAARGPVAHVLQPSVWIYVAGHKRARVGREVHELSAGDVHVLARPTTVISEIVSAPYLCVMLSVDASLIASLAAAPRAVSSSISEPLTRLARLLDTPSEIPVLAPLLQRELFFRLLAGPAGDDLRELARGHDALLASALAWLEARYAEPFSAQLLAAHVGSSVSALYARFKERMGVTPLQYQKRLRLEAARRLLFSGELDVSAVASRVGYASAAHFSRDYRRAFAAPPRRDRALRS
ncbi:MAG TPA: AraC family transcriptional regulator N-terminal domain-containing protein [Polyangiaceae bacterium]|nr:AraC family transcriptional regulator N-terminal domain-containing protein [Polyangiaceae bacterium]